MEDRQIKNNQITLKEISKITGAAYRTVADYAKRMGWTENGKKTLLNEQQVTIILEAMKVSTGQGGKRAAQNKKNLALAMQGTETSQSLDFQLALIEKKAHELWKRKALETEIKLMKTRELLESRTNGLEVYQRIAETAGLVLSDRDDLSNLYKRF